VYYEPTPEQIAALEAAKQKRRDCRYTWHPSEENEEGYARARKAEIEYRNLVRSIYPHRYTRQLEQTVKLENALDMIIDHLPMGDIRDAEIVVRYLELDEWEYRSGYIRERALRVLKHTPIPDDMQDRLRKIVLMVIDKADGRREFPYYRRMARKLDNSWLRAQLQQRIDTDTNPRVHERAQWAMNACLRKG